MHTGKIQATVSATTDAVRRQKLLEDEGDEEDEECVECESEQEEDGC